MRGHRQRQRRRRRAGLSHVDGLSQGISQLPVRAGVTRPVVGQYLSMMRSLAAAWQARTRPALAGALEALALVGDSLGQPPTLAALRQPRQAGVRMADGLLRRLAAPGSTLTALSADLGSFLAQMARASNELECDTALVTERVQSDAVHAFLLSQQASALQSELDDATVRQRALAAGAPCPAPASEEIALHSSALEGVRRQLGQLQTEQSATRAEADYLQTLLPTLSAYLAALERMHAGIEATRGHGRAMHRTGRTRGGTGDGPERAGVSGPATIVRGTAALGVAWLSAAAALRKPGAPRT
ncbi:hypothetical protein LP420_36955 [Massilia sp. B-10]|nr:hypothetical protein LP420_36955 [Massilia sp. B-10]